MSRVAIVGTVGLPAAYGGFETLAENLVLFGEDKGASTRLTVYCSGRSSGKVHGFHGAELVYVPVKANGISSILYDAISIFSAVSRRADVILVLGVSGAVVLPLVRFFTNVRLITNIDGIEWRRAKWGVLARLFLRMSERIAVRFSHVTIADNEAIADYVSATYGQSCRVIAYGGDHALNFPASEPTSDANSTYAFGLCRIEPENNVEMVLHAFSLMPDRPLVFVGNWDASAYGRRLRDRYERVANIKLMDPIYDACALGPLRRGADCYVHGHSAGGTNPSLVEMMHFGCPVVAFDCVYNRATTGQQALYFGDPGELVERIRSIYAGRGCGIGDAMKSLARKKFTWERVAQAYFHLFERSS